MSVNYYLYLLYWGYYKGGGGELASVAQRKRMLIFGVMAPNNTKTNLLCKWVAYAMDPWDF